MDVGYNKQIIPDRRNDRDIQGLVDKNRQCFLSLRTNVRGYVGAVPRTTYPGLSPLSLGTWVVRQSVSPMGPPQAFFSDGQVHGPRHEDLVFYMRKYAYWQATWTNSEWSADEHDRQPSTCYSQRHTQRCLTYLATPLVA